jgi:hypothetical protein
LRFTAEPDHSIPVAGDAVRKNLECNVPSEVRIAGTIDLPRSSGAERREDLVRTESNTRGHAHAKLIIGGERR